MVTRGAGSEQQTIKLELTVDKAELERQLGQVFQGPMAPEGGTGGARGRGPMKPTRVEPGQQMNKSLKNLVHLAGIYFGISAMVKNSQVMSTSLNALGSVMGAMMDSFLAPLVPKLLPVLNKIADMLPGAAKAGQTTAETIDDLGEFGNKLKQSREENRWKWNGPLTQVATGSIMDTLRWAGKGIPGVTGMIGEPTGISETERINKLRSQAGLGKLGWLSTILGPTGAQRKETYSALFGETTPEGRMSSKTSQVVAKFDEEQMTQFLRAQERPTVVNVHGNTVDEIMGKVRDVFSGSFLGR